MDQKQKAVLYSGGGLVDDKLASQPMRAEERHNRHRAVDDCICYDCGNVIERGSVKVVSQITLTQGVKAQTWSMDIHPECYDVLSQVMAIIPTEDRSVTGRGRVTLRELWQQHRDIIEQADYRLARMLASAFGVGV